MHDSEAQFWTAFDEKFKPGFKANLERELKDGFSRTRLALTDWENMLPSIFLRAWGLTCSSFADAYLYALSRDGYNISPDEAFKEAHIRYYNYAREIVLFAHPLLDNVPDLLPQRERGEPAEEPLARPGWAYWPFVLLVRAWMFLGGAKVTGRSNRPARGAYVACANHINIADPVLLYVLLTKRRRPVYFIAKEEVKESRIQRFFTAQARTILVNRENPSREAHKLAKQVLNDGCVLVIFPEGHRNKQEEELLSFHDGAAHYAISCNVPILPIHISWRGVRAHIVIGETISPASVRNKRELTALVRESIVRLGKEKSR